MYVHIIILSVFLDIRRDIYTITFLNIIHCWHVIMSNLVSCLNLYHFALKQFYLLVSLLACFLHILFMIVLCSCALYFILYIRTLLSILGAVCVKNLCVVHIGYFMCQEDFCYSVWVFYITGTFLLF